MCVWGGGGIFTYGLEMRVLADRGTCMSLRPYIVWSQSQSLYGCTVHMTVRITTDLNLIRILSALTVIAEQPSLIQEILLTKKVPFYTLIDSS